MFTYCNVYAGESNASLSSEYELFSDDEGKSDASPSRDVYEFFSGDEGENLVSNYVATYCMYILLCI